MQSGYFATSWSDIKNSPGWFGKVCLLGLLSFIPVFGQMILYGYSYAWARDIAWDIHQPMPAKIFGNEDGKLYSRGASAWLITFIAAFISSFIGMLLGDSTFSSLVVLVLTLFLSVFASVGIMRMAIYGRLSAGFQIKKMWAMTAHDTNGLLRILGMTLLLSLIAGVIFGVVLFAIIMLFTIIGVASAGAGIDWNALEYSLTYGGNAYSQLSSLIATLAPAIGVGMLVLLVVIYVLMCVCTWVNLLQARAMGYWVRQFEVAKWRGQDDPMPFELNPQAAAPAAQPAPVQPQAQPVQPQPQSDPVPVVADPSQQPAGSVPAEPFVAVAPVAVPEAAASQTVADSDAAAPAKTVVCPACGQTVDGTNARFCVQCGARLASDDEAQ